MAYDIVMTSGTLIRQARMRAGLSQVELSERSGKDRAQIARWERDVVQPSLETLRELLQACGFDLELRLVPFRPPDAGAASRLHVALEPTPPRPRRRRAGRPRSPPLDRLPRRSRAHARRPRPRPGPRATAHPPETDRARAPAPPPAHDRALMAPLDALAYRNYQPR